MSHNQGRQWFLVVDPNFSGVLGALLRIDATSNAIDLLAEAGAC